jgi:hypothetical protein
MSFVTWPVPQPQPALQPASKTLAPPPAGLPAVRQLGAITVTTQTILRAVALNRDRTASSPIVLGRALQPQSLAHARTQGAVVVQKPLQPLALVRTRSLGPVEVNEPVLLIPALSRA